MTEKKKRVDDPLRSYHSMFDENDFSKSILQNGIGLLCNQFIVSLSLKNKFMTAAVYIVNCIDTEGPLNEPINATFERIKDTLNIEEIPYEHNWHNLNKILRKMKLS